MDALHHVALVRSANTAADGARAELEDAGFHVTVVGLDRGLYRVIVQTEPPVDSIIAWGLTADELERVRSTLATADQELTVILAGGTPTPDSPHHEPLQQGLVQQDLSLAQTAFLGVERTALLRRSRFLESRFSQVSHNSGAQVRETQDVAIFGLAKMVESRDQDTGLHLERMAEYSRLLAFKLRSNPVFAGYIDDNYVIDIWRSAPLHDIGKVGVPDSILLKPGKLNAEEWETMKTHSSVGGDTLREIERRLHYRSFLQMGRDIAYCHHERWDGNGYPFGLVKDEIPLSARIVALADVYDALTSRRPYKEPFSHEKATAIITEGVGTQFDPCVFEAFEELKDRFIEVAEQHQPEPLSSEEITRRIHELEIARYRRAGKRARSLRKALSKTPVVKEA